MVAPHQSTADDESSKSRTTTSDVGSGGGRAQNKPSKYAETTERRESWTSRARRTGKLHPHLVVRTDKEVSERGRGLFATRDICRGTELARVRAVAAIVSSSRRHKVCCRCFTSLAIDGGSFSACSSCGDRFCNDCVTAAGREGIHAATCGVAQVFQAQPAAVSDLARLAAQCLATRRSRITEEEWDVINSLEAHKSPQRLEADSRLLRQAVQRLREAADIDVTEDDLRTMYLR